MSYLYENERGILQEKADKFIELIEQIKKDTLENYDAEIFLAWDNGKLSPKIRFSKANTSWRIII